MTPLEALQQTLAGEHAAVYVYRALAGRVSASAQPTLAAGLSSAYTTHRGRRDQLTAMVRAAGGDPVAADISYELPNPARTAAQLTEGALVTEKRCAKPENSCRAKSVRANRDGLKPSTGPSSRRSGSMPPPPYTRRPLSVYFRSFGSCDRFASWSRSVYERYSSNVPSQGRWIRRPLGV